VAARITALLALVAVVLAGVFVAYRALTREAAEDTAGAFVQRWSAGKDAAAAQLTDDPTAAAAALKANRQGLDGARLKASLGEVKESGASVTATLSLHWQVPRVGDGGTTRSSACAGPATSGACAGRPPWCIRSSTQRPGSGPPPCQGRAGRSSTAIGGR